MTRQNKVTNRWLGITCFVRRRVTKLSDKKEYEEAGNPYYVSLLTKSTVKLYLPGELTIRVISSLIVVLFNFSMLLYKNRKKNSPLYWKSALSLRDLKKTSEGREDRNVHIWYALQH